MKEDLERWKKRAHKLVEQSKAVDIEEHQKLQEEKKGLDALKTKLEGELSTIRTEVQTLRTRAGAKEAELSKLKTQNSALNATVTDLRSKVVNRDEIGGQFEKRVD